MEIRTATEQEAAWVSQLEHGGKGRAKAVYVWKVKG